MVFIDDSDLIEKEYKNCSFTLKQLDNSIKPCIEIKNASIPYDLAKIPIFSDREFRKEVFENITFLDWYEKLSRLNTSYREFELE